MAKETNQVLGHGADADGIEEYDNPLPDWWLGLFIFCIIYAIGYSANYHFISQDSQEKRYEVMMAEAAKQWPVKEGPVAVSMDAESIQAGSDVFAQTCASCHNADLTGGIGPSLVDAEWIHGGEPEQVVATITNGVSDKGMPAWGPILGPKKVQQVAAFVLSKKGTGGGKTAQADTQGGQDGTPANGSDGTAAADPAAGSVTGKQIFEQNCVACHAADMTGGVGPSLVDDEWIHGGTLEEITATITNGVPEKGMIQWGPVLGDEKIALVAQFVHSKGADAGSGAM